MVDRRAPPHLTRVASSTPPSNADANPLRQINLYHTVALRQCRDRLLPLSRTDRHSHRRTLLGGSATTPSWISRPSSLMRTDTYAPVCFRWSLLHADPGRECADFLFVDPGSRERAMHKNWRISATLRRDDVQHPLIMDASSPRPCTPDDELPWLGGRRGHPPAA